MFSMSSLIYHISNTGYGVSWTDDHDVHHAKFNWNFGGMPHWDLAFGTMIPNEFKDDKAKRAKKTC